MQEIQYGYLVTKDAKKEAKVHNVHFLLDPVTKAVCLVSNKNSEILNHIKSNHSVTVSYYNSKLGKYTRMSGIASIPQDMLCDFERRASKALNPQAKKTEVLVYIEMNHVEVVAVKHPATSALHTLAI
jgi:hypothetical protein